MPLICSGRRVLPLTSAYFNTLWLVKKRIPFVQDEKVTERQVHCSLSSISHLEYWRNLSIFYLLPNEIPLQHALTGAGSLLRKSFIERVLLFCI